MTALHIGFDLDGVIYDFVDDFRNCLMKHTGKDEWNFPEPKEYDFLASWGLSATEYHTHIHEGIRSGELFTSGRPYLYAIETLQDLRNQGHEISFITARPMEARYVTAEWLSQHLDFNDWNLHFSENKVREDLDFYFDDKPENVEDCIQAGMNAYLVSQPWNENTSLPRVNMQGVKMAVAWAVDVNEWQKQLAPPSTDEVRSTSPTGGQKGRKPERMSLVPSEATEARARVYAFGEQKYEANNWRRGYDWGLSLDALERHIGAFKRGEDIDPESGLPHLAHAGAHVDFLLYWTTYPDRYAQFDDRYKPEEQDNGETS